MDNKKGASSPLDWEGEEEGKDGRTAEKRNV
jgi:hypothetical protein